jgi:hypothetical protein
MPTLARSISSVARPRIIQHQIYGCVTPHIPKALTITPARPFPRPFRPSPAFHSTQQSPVPITTPVIANMVSTTAARGCG